MNLLLTITCALLLQNPPQNADKKLINIQRISSPVTVDGVPDETA